LRRCGITHHKKPRPVFQAFRVTNGKSRKLGTMPPFEDNLTSKQIQDVAAFVYASTH
jgi:mono/diheme cytochrome c family protein